MCWLILHPTQKRLIDGGALASYPSMLKLSEGTIKDPMMLWHLKYVQLFLPFFTHMLFQEKGELLRRWISSNENLQSCEAAIQSSRTNTLEGKRTVRLIAVKDMGKKPYNFSQPLDL